MRSDWNAALLVAIVAFTAIFSLVFNSSSISTAPTLTGNVVQNPSLPNLMVIGLASAPSSPVVDSPVTVRFLVFNTGAAEAMVVANLVNDGGADSRESTPVNSRIPMCDDGIILAPRKACWVQERLTYNTAGVKTLTATVDADKEVTETKDEDNTRTKRIVVRAASRTGSETNPQCKQIGQVRTAGTECCDTATATVGSTCTAPTTCTVSGYAPTAQKPCCTGALTGGICLPTCTTAAKACTERGESCTEGGNGFNCAKLTDAYACTGTCVGSGPCGSVNQEVCRQGSTSDCNGMRDANIPYVKSNDFCCPAGQTYTSGRCTGTSTISPKACTATSTNADWCTTDGGGKTCVKRNTYDYVGYCLPTCSAQQLRNDLGICVTPNANNQCSQTPASTCTSIGQTLCTVSTNTLNCNIPQGACTGTCTAAGNNGGNACSTTPTKPCENAATTACTTNSANGAFVCTKIGAACTGTCTATSASCGGVTLTVVSLTPNRQGTTIPATIVLDAWYQITSAAAAPVTVDFSTNGAPTTYDITKTSTRTASGIYGESVTLTNLAPGTYTYRARLRTTCLGGNTIEVIAPPQAITISNTTFVCSATTRGQTCPQLTSPANGHQCIAGQTISGNVPRCCVAGETWDGNSCGTLCTTVVTPCTVAGQTGCTVSSTNGAFMCTKATGACTGTCTGLQCIASGSSAPGTCCSPNTRNAQGVCTTATNACAGTAALTCTTAGQTLCTSSSANGALFCYKAPGACTGTCTAVAACVMEGTPTSTNNCCPGYAFFGSYCCAFGRVAGANGCVTPAPAAPDARLDAIINGGTSSLASFAKTVGTGNYGDAPAASGCAAGLTPTNERAITVCRVATRSPQLPPLIETQTNPRTSVYAYYNAAWSVLGDIGTYGGDCTMVTPTIFGTAVAYGLVPNTYAGYETLTSWMCQTNAPAEQWYSQGRAKWLSTGMLTGPPDANMLRHRVNNGGNLVTGIKLDRTAATSNTIQSITAYSTQAPYAAIGPRTQITITGGTGDLTADIQFSQPVTAPVTGGVSELTACKYIPVTLGTSTPLTLGGQTANKIGTNLFRISTISSGLATPVDTKVFRIFCTDSKTPQKVEDDYSWRLVGEVELRIVTPVVKSLDCNIGTTAGYSSWTTRTGDPLMRFADRVSMKPVTAVISGNSVSIANQGETQTVVRRDDASQIAAFAAVPDAGRYKSVGTTTVEIAGFPESSPCTGTTCLRNPWGNVDRVFLPDFSQGGACPGSKWCDRSVPPRVADERPWIYNPISQAQYTGGLAFIDSIDGAAGFGVNVWAGQDARIGRIRRVNYQNGGGYAQVNRIFGNPWASWTEYQITCT